VILSAKELTVQHDVAERRQNTRVLTREEMMLDNIAYFNVKSSKGK
jgi:hypothetical protein